MKSKLPFILTLVLFSLAFVLLPVVAFAQEASPAAGQLAINADSIVQWLTPLLVPLLLAGVKKFAPEMPKWVLPICAPVLGFLIGVINNLMSAHADNLWLAAGLGLLGVAVREVKEAIKPAPNGGWPVT